MFEIDPSIINIITVPDWRPNEASPLQGFAPSLCRNSWMFRAASLLPATVYDLTDIGQETLVARRISGKFPISCFAQSPRAVRSYSHPVFLPFTLFYISDEEKLSDYEDWAKSAILRPTIVASSGGDIRFDELTIERLQEHFLAKLDQIPKDADPKSLAEMTEALKSWKRTDARQLGYKVGGHNSVAPNLMALQTAGFDDLIYGEFKDIGNGVQPYVDQIVLTTNSILDERERVGGLYIESTFPPTPDINLFSPSIYPHFFEVKLPQSVPISERKSFDAIRSLLQRQKGYGFEARTEQQRKAMIGEGKVPTPHPLMKIRSQELKFATDVMGGLAASNFSAVVRMPNEVDRTSGSVRSFAQHYRGQTPKSRKRLLAFREVQNRLSSAVPTEFYDLIRRSISGIRIVSDAHLEWLDIDGLPLMIRKTCTRIPVTPGNLFVDQVGTLPIMHLTPGDLQKVLVISALKSSDPIAGIFEQAFKAFSDRWAGKLDLRIVEATSVDDFVNAVNTFDGNVLVFDGHGSHKVGGPANLHLGEEAVDIWSLKDRIERIPPIIILSACDTHAADRNHATTANGFLSLGARTVLSSVFPLEARHAAIFTARFLYRLANFVGPAIRLFEHSLRWSDVVAGMLRMQLLTDFLRNLEQKKLLTDEALYREVHLEGNLAINGGDLEPFEIVINLLKEKGIDESKLRSGLEEAVANSAVISYLQIGRPETIVIDDPQRSDSVVENN